MMSGNDDSAHLRSTPKPDLLEVDPSAAYQVFDLPLSRRELTSTGLEFNYDYLVVIKEDSIHGRPQELEFLRVSGEVL